MIGAAPTSNFWTTGGSMPAGSSASVAETRSRTSWTALSTFTSSSNWMRTWVTLSRLIDRSTLMPLIVLSASSIGSATLVSIDSGSAPG